MSNLAKAIAVKKQQAECAIPSHLMVEARAGTGKTTTLIEGLKYLRGLPTSIQPSPQQQAIWDSLALSRGAVSIAFVAFNSSIAAELRQRVPAGVEASTMHSLGYKAVRNAFRLRQGPDAINADRVTDIICELVGADLHTFRRSKPVVLSTTRHLVGLCKSNLYTGTEAELTELIQRHNVEIENGRDEREVRDLVPRVMVRCLEVDQDGCVDYNDQIWLPVALSLPIIKRNLLLCDEVQDFNKCQQALARMAGTRLVVVGDPAQAIYGFTGADSESMPNLKRDLSADPNGCDVLSLTVTRRCCKAVVVEAKRYVPEFEAHESNPEGSVETSLYPLQPNPRGSQSPPVPCPVDKSYLRLVRDGDMVICRTNAPLVSQCFTFIKVGRRAHIQGKDVGKGITNLLKKLDAGTIPDLVSKLDEWVYAETRKEQARRHPDESKISRIQDQADCIRAVIDGNPEATTADALVWKIEQLFTDAKDQPGIRLSSVHKAKGLEARTVFFLQPRVLFNRRPKSDWEAEQERNLTYVAITRAIERLVYVL